MVTREDILRELELMPVWLERNSAPQGKVPAQLVAVDQTLNKPLNKPMKTLPEYTPINAVDTKAESTANVMNAGLHTNIKAEVVELERSAPEIAEPSVENNLNSINPNVKPKKRLPWLLVCDMRANTSAEANTLLKHIIKAMRLTLGEFEVLSEMHALEQYAAKKLIFFGVESIHTSISKIVVANNALTVEALRGRKISLEEGFCWVTYSLAAMLENPALKALVWQDLQLAMQAE
jgi:hypothetical protein